MEEVQGIISEVVFRNEQNGYTVLELQVEKDTYTVVGYFAYINIGERIKAMGRWIQHPDYGKQFKMESYSVIEPSTINSIEKYLASGLISGIGPHTAKKMVEKFGLDTLDIIQYNPDRLVEIEGIGSIKAQKISEAFQEQKELKDIMIFLEQYDIGPSYAVRIYKAYGNNTIKEIKENPYKLTEDIVGIGFKLSDRVAISIGIPHDSEYRLDSGTKYMLNRYHGKGHTFVPEEELVSSTSELLGVSTDAVNDAIVRMFINKKIVVEQLENIRAVYSTAFFRAEAGVTRRLLEFFTYKIPSISLKMDDEISKIEKSEGIVLADRQKQAVKEVFDNGIMVITGGPGTGKTTTIKTIINLLEKNELEVLLAAPTGRAAKRMQEATKREAKTIHRLLEYGYGEDEEEMFFQRNQDSPLECDVIIVDEVSMIDIMLMSSLLKAVAVGTRVVLVGDVDQLPSVGPGNVLRDIIDCGIIPVVILDEIFRQAEESMIVVNAHRINRGEVPYINVKDKDFFFIKQENEEEIVNTVLNLCKERLPKFSGFNFMDGIQVLSPMKKGVCGVLNLNNKLQSILNPADNVKTEKKTRDIVFRVGDKVMQIKNNYKMKWHSLSELEKEGEGVFNGDMGIIINIDNEEQFLEVVFDNDKLIKYDYGIIDELELAYALTVHKSQGSEFPVLVMPITYGPSMLLTRNLLYTALTRAKKLVVMVGKEKYITQMVHNNYITNRYSGLKDRLVKLVEV